VYLHRRFERGGIRGFALRPSESPTARVVRGGLNIPIISEQLDRLAPFGSRGQAELLILDRQRRHAPAEQQQRVPRRRVLEDPPIRALHPKSHRSRASPNSSPAHPTKPRNQPIMYPEMNVG